MDKFDYLSDTQYIENLFNDYKKDPESIDESWRKFFEGFEFARSHFKTSEEGIQVFDTEFKILNLIDGYRKRGHLFTKTNPVRTRRKYSPDLSIENFGLSQANLDQDFHAGNEIGIGNTTLRNIIDHLEQTYCQSIGTEYMFIRKPEVVDWLKKRLESDKNTPRFTKSQKKHFFQHLVQAVGFENFIHKKFIGQKRFSLEGAEALIPALDAVIEKGSEMGIREFVIGMSHRGRLNVLTNILKKPYSSVFSEYAGKEYDDESILGDVKYHLGYDTERKTDNGHKIRLSLLPNPSHLETVTPVTLGMARSRIDNAYNGDINKLCPIVIHGDSAIAAQGVVYETIQMSQLNGYGVGGTIHLVINNQVGFTTNYLEARSSTYCTDVGKVILSPVFHVNGDDVDAVIHTIRMGMEYREIFHTDVFIDILCYRRYGHNEGDEPRFTQPILYKAIASHPNVRDIYGKQLIDNGILTNDEVSIMQEQFNNLLEENLAQAKNSETVPFRHFLDITWNPYRYAVSDDFNSSPDTGIKEKTLKELVEKMHKLPGDRKFFKKIEKLFADRKNMVAEGKTDWATGELLAYASLLTEGIPVRLSGQDSERGTFSHRHAALIVEDTDEKYYPLKHLSEKQAHFEIRNSLLSEYGVMGFEYGYALANPGGLTIWEAQFGDFHNVAQVIIDQYISSSEEKWGLMNGLVLMLPHGYEGQGPEHSSARIERFLSLAANNNIQLVNTSTPANLFHVLRRQVKYEFRKPLVLFTPKSLLRHPACISSLNEYEGSFREVIGDNVPDKTQIKQVALCSGKIYYDLAAERENLNDTETALVRIEQLYPVPSSQIKSIINSYPNARQVLWVQEEPANMGAWPYYSQHLDIQNLLGVCRPESGSPAAGLHELHIKRQHKILDKVFKKCNCNNLEIYCSMKCTN